MASDSNSGNWITAAFVAAGSLLSAIITKYWPNRIRRKREDIDRLEQQKEGLEDIYSRGTQWLIGEYRGQIEELWKEIGRLRQENVTLRNENDLLRSEIDAINKRLDSGK